MNASKTLATGAAIVAASFAGAGVVLALDNGRAGNGPLLAPTPAAPQTASASGTVTHVADTPATAKQIYEATFHDIAQPGVAPLAANYTIPLIASAGPNLQSGLSFKSDQTQTASPDAADNIFSIQLKLD